MPIRTLSWFSQIRGSNGASSGARALVPGMNDQSREPGVVVGGALAACGVDGVRAGPLGIEGGRGAGGS